ncbi:hypothetical protein KP509_07G063600 [Ceratopteris richardii]|uniref:Uncharacterized protein n=1 Tax=Ceratopteris richardii TaxID=49495 RepID=A0A8T2UBK6_CERRI|nr:hypothetical protein KP509_07G063600 [Ceratopteris richardii]
MPRPGPRPYECVRRAWHSDTHQPLRGTLIREIFRLVHLLHSTSTRRNKEWQEKLPIVVLRAEEILYSKANSEGEYADVETLRSRLDDAMNTLIRREEGEEEGVYLMPCVEAALSLGCSAKRGQRGHRNGSSRHLANAASSNLPASATSAGTEDCSARATRMDPSNHTHNSHANSSLISLTQAQPFCQSKQNSQPLTYEPSSSLGPAAALCPRPCYPIDATAFMFPQAPTSLKYGFIERPYPKQGTFVQFLKTGNANGFPDIQPGDGAPYTSYLKPVDAALPLSSIEVMDQQENSWPGIGSPNLKGYAGACLFDTVSVHAIPRLPSWVTHGDRQKHIPSIDATAACANDRISHDVGHVPVSESFSDLQVMEINPPPVTRPAGSHSCNSKLPSWLSPRCDGVQTSEVIEESALLHEDDHLQLRLGLPVNEPYTVSVSMGTTSISKRMRVDKSSE